MYSLIKKRTINEIIASRKSKRSKREQMFFHPPVQSELAPEFKMDLFVKKTSFNGEDKLLLLQHLEKKYRLRFDQSFNFALINWLIVKEKKILDKYYDSSKKSYYLLRGHLSVCEKVGNTDHLLRETQDSDSKAIHRYEESYSVEG